MELWMLCGVGSVRRSIRQRVLRKRLEARVRIELTIEVLQTSALPLGYRAGSFFENAALK
jgi:hypothetical protein